jgi:type IV pilus assembly protein PilQ
MSTKDGKRKVIIAAAVVLLVLTVALILYSTPAKKPVLSASSNIKTKKTVKSSKPAKKKTKVTDSNHVSDGNRPASLPKLSASSTLSNTGNKKSVKSKSSKLVDKKVKIAEDSQMTVDSNQVAAIIEAFKSSAAAEANDNNEVSNNSRIASVDKPVENNPIEPDEELIIKEASDIKPKSANLSPNLGSIQSNIQSLIFMRNMPISDALQLLGVRYGKNIVPTSKVSGNIAFTKLNNVSFEEAMSAILGEEFEYQEQGNLIKVYTAGDNSKVKPDSSGMVCKVFTLYYITAAEAKKMVTPVMSSSGKIEITTAAVTTMPDSDTIGGVGGGDALAINDMMVVYDYPEQITQIEQIIAAIDIRPKQVLIEATIMTAALTDGTQFGIDWRNLKNVALELTPGAPDIFDFYGTDTKIGSSALTGGLSVGVVRDDVAVFIRAVEEITDVTILANPKILATNKQLGQVYIGTKVAYQSAVTQTDTSTTQTIEFLDTGTKLSFRPYIGNDGYIRMDIHPKDSSAVIRNIGTSSVPDETSAELVSNIIVKDGETIIIGGLFRNTVSNKKTQVPLLGNLPVVGTAFSSTADEGRREEVIVLLTPHIIGEPSQTMGIERSEDVGRKISGAKKQLNPLNRMRLAQDSYEKGAVNYAQGRNAAALKELESALELYPDYTEAIELKEKIYSEIAPSRKPVREIIDQIEQPKLHKWRKR